MDNKRVFAWIAGVILLVLGAYAALNRGSDSPKPNTISARFVCANNRFINATFNNEGAGSVDLSLSDGRKVALPRAMSASGARYANSDESFVFWNKGDTAFIDEKGERTFTDCATMGDDAGADGNTRLANPASANCLAQGGTLEMRNNAKGQYGVCLFEDNRQCEEWALLRGQCPVGGRKITGYENDAQIYCAITGGSVEGMGTDSVLCRRVDGTLCEIGANYNGDCPDPNDPNPNSGNTETD